MALFLPLDKRNTHDKAKGLCITSERYIGELGVRSPSTIRRGRTRGNSLLYSYAMGKKSYQRACAKR